MSDDLRGTVCTPSKKTATRMVWLLVVGVCMVATAACTGQVHSNSGVTAPGSAVTASGTPSASSEKPSVVPPVIDVTTQPGSVPSYVGALKDVFGQTCTAGAGGVTASGTVTNPKSTPQDYRIYISVLNTNQTLGVTEVDVLGVAPGASQQWSGVVAVQVTDPQCVLRVERNDAKA